MLSGVFISNAILAEFIGVKLFSLEKTFGFQAVDWQLFGIDHLSFNMTAGVLLWPVVFVLTDIINEYYGMKGVRFLSYFTVFLIASAFLFTFLAIQLTPADFWIERKSSTGEIVNMDLAFNNIFGQGLWIIFGSLVAFLIGQFVDVFIFHKIKTITGSRKIWLRATGSTLVSQLIDSFVVLFIAFYLGTNFQYKLNWVLAIAIVNYTYKFIVAVLMTPILYMIHFLIEKYLGKSLAHQLMESAKN